MSQHLQWPPAIGGDGAFATVEADSLADLQQSVGLISLLRPDSLAWDETLGIPDPIGTHLPEVAAMQIQDALADCEPRATTQVTVTPPVGGRDLHLQIEVTDG